MKKNVLTLLAATIFAVAEPPQQLESLTVAATHIPVRKEALGQHLELIDNVDLANSKDQSLTNALINVPGLELKSYGPYDSNATLSIRGMARFHTKVLIDGIPYMDYSGTQAMPLLGNISLNNVERVEVLKGAVSLQGSSAMGGIVNIVLKSPEKDGLHGRITMEAGSHARLNSAVELTGKGKLYDFKISLGRNRERGLSVVRHDMYGNVNMDNDHYRDITYAAAANFNLSENWRLSLGGQFQDIDEEYDSGYSYGDYVSPDQDNVYVRRSMGHIKLLGSNLFQGKVSTRLTYAATRSDRAYLNKKRTEYRYLGNMETALWNGDWHINDKNTLSMGLEYSAEHARNFSLHKSTLDESQHSNAAFLGLQTEPADNLFLNINGRYTHQSTFGSEWTGDAAVKYHLESTGTTFSASLGKGYRSPSAYELFAPPSGTFLGGNPNLKPETCVTWEIGTEQQLLGNTISLGTSYFESNVNNLIVSTSQSFSQIDGTSNRGVETFVKWQPNQALALRMSYTYQRARDVETGNKHIAYIPRHKALFSMNWKPLKNDTLNLNFNSVWTGSRFNENNGDGSKCKLDDFLLMNAAISWKLSQFIELYTRVENILNTRYTLSNDFGTQYNSYGRTFYIGAIFSF